MRKTAAISVRVRDDVKEAAEKAAADDHRPLASYVEKLLTEHLKAEGYLPGEKPHARRIAQSAAVAKGMAHSAIDKVLEHSTESASVHRDRRRAITEIPKGVVVKDRRRK